ncbi:MAG: YqgE/AlgH family protein, partial [Alphaproteobacteria bacterium]|nr:YqgE/AlgH family protein [Alphaproteobacteria bacterium]
MNKKLSEKENNSSLMGKLLVYIGQDSDDIYDNSVIYITENTSEGSKGIMINKLLFATAALECKSPLKEGTELKS